MVCSKSLRRFLCCVIPQSSTDSIEVNLFDSIPLPQDILIQILLLLPFKSVLDCKLVSKQLKNLIDDPMFSNAYSENNPTPLILINTTLCFISIQGKKKKLVNDPIPPYTKHRIPIEFKIKNVKPEASNYNLLIGLSKRVACVKAGNDDFLIYNSFTGASYAVWDGPKEQSFVCYGFGYDPYDDDHNIFVASKLGKFWVYTLRSKVWKSFKSFPYADYDWKTLPWTYREQDRAYSFSGVLHWLVFTTSGGEENLKEVIVTYDMHTRRFGEILVPLANERDETSHTTTFSE